MRNAANDAELVNSVNNVVADARLVKVLEIAVKDARLVQCWGFGTMVKDAPGPVLGIWNYGQGCAPGPGLDSMGFGSTVKDAGLVQG